jgi:hypothetical protein
MEKGGLGGGGSGLDFAGEGGDFSFGAVGPRGALFDPEAESFFFRIEEAMFYGRHGAFFAVFEEDELVEGAGAGIAGDDEGAVGAGFEGEGFGFEIEIAEEEAGVVAGEAVFLEDGFDVGDEIDGLGSGVGFGFVGDLAGAGGREGDGDQRRDEEECSKRGENLIGHGEGSPFGPLRARH